jgi:signal transduction histidine kinase
MLALRDAREAHDVLAIVARTLARDVRRPCTAYEYRGGVFRPVATSDASVERKPFTLTDPERDSLRLRVLMRRHGLDYVGISSDGQLRAVFVLEGSGGALSDDDSKFLRAIASHVSLALASALAFEQLRRYAAEGAALTEAARTILGFTELEPLALSLCRLCARLVQAEKVAVYLRRGDVLERIAVATSRESTPFPLELPPDDQTRPALAAACGDRALAVADLTGGLLVCSRRDAFDKADQRLVETFATLATLGMRNVDLYEESTRANQALAESNAFKDDLMAMFAHDFNGPLTVISGYSELLFDVEDPEIRSSAEKIVEQTRRLARLSEDALALAATQSAGFSLQRAFANLTDFVRVATEPLDRDGRITIEAPAAPVVVSFDRTRLRHAIDNVLGNALKYSSGTVRVSVEPGERDVAIVVADCGIGIPPGDLERIFSRFGRAANARSRGITGSGVGLYIAKKIVDIHGGRVEVSSVENEGSTFRIVLPR